MKLKSPALEINVLDFMLPPLSGWESGAGSVEPLDGKGRRIRLSAATVCAHNVVCQGKPAHSTFNGVRRVALVLQ